jgi:predicted GNAT superfamily acetyltransferase
VFRDDHVTLRPLETRQECLTYVSLQREISGKDFVDIVPATILMVSQRVGDVAGGAFDTKDRLVGFVFGISGVADGVLAHWSHMLAVRPEARRIGLGRRLKLYQRT